MSLYIYTTYMFISLYINFYIYIYIYTKYIYVCVTLPQFVFLMLRWAWTRRVTWWRGWAPTSLIKALTPGSSISTASSNTSTNGYALRLLVHWAAVCRVLSFAYSSYCLTPIAHLSTSVFIVLLIDRLKLLIIVSFLLILGCGWESGLLILMKMMTVISNSVRCYQNRVIFSLITLIKKFQSCLQVC